MTLINIGQNEEWGILSEYFSRALLITIASFTLMHGAKKSLRFKLKTEEESVFNRLILEEVR